MPHPSHPFSPLNRHFLTDSQFVSTHRLAAVLAIALLSACATSPQGRTQLTAPAAIGDVYSDVNMRVHLAAAKNINTSCVNEECAPNKQFDQQVQQLGARLSKSAFESYPDLGTRIKGFEFVVSEKEEEGSTSNAAGKVVIFRGVQELNLDEQALAFLIGREMGHIVSRHHDENTGTSMLISVLVGVLFPVSNLFHGAALANATSSATLTTTAATTAASSATSYAGSQAVLASVKPDQFREADFIAVKLLAGSGWSGRETADILEACTQVDGDSAWAKDFRISAGYATALEEQIAIASTGPEAKPSDFLALQSINQQANPGVLSEMGLITEPALDLSKANKPEGNSQSVDVEVVAKNDVSILSDTANADPLTLPVASAEEQNARIEEGASDAFAEEPQLADATSHQVAKLSLRGAPAKKITARAGMNRNASNMTSKKTSKVESRNAKPKLAKAAVSGKQAVARKTYANKSSKTILAKNSAHKSKETTASNGVKSVSVKSMGVKSRLDKITQVKTAQIKIE